MENDKNYQGNGRYHYEDKVNENNSSLPGNVPLSYVGAGALQIPPTSRPDEKR